MTIETPYITLAAAVLAVVSSLLNRKKLQTIAIQIDGKMDKMIASAETIAHASGKLEGILEERNKPMIPAHEAQVKPAPVEIVGASVTVPVVIESTKK